jgi:RNA polymerase sigma factor (sigma-70 family)
VTFDEVPGEAVTGLLAAPEDARPGAFSEFYARWSGDAQRYAWAIAGPDCAEDACQDAWERIWRHWDRPEPDRREAWALRIVRNCCLDRLRAGRRTTPVADPDPGVEGDAEDEAIRRLEVDASLRLLAKLPVALRETLWLREVAGLSYAEIAEMQAIPVGTVMSRLHSARKRLGKLVRA